VIIIDTDLALDRLASQLRRTLTSGVWDGQTPTAYFARCRAVNALLGVVAIFTRDRGHHTSGWWKNPDYERCQHLSLSFFDPETGESRPRDRKLTAGLLDRLFGRDKRLLWCEPPYSPEGKQRDVWHYRLFCDPAWEAIHPRGEVYNREFTEAGWKSFSDVQADLEEQRQAVLEATS
jgi:hypothetical protein